MIEHNEIDNILEDSLKSYSPKADDRHRIRFFGGSFNIRCATNQ